MPASKSSKTSRASKKRAAAGAAGVLTAAAAVSLTALWWAWKQGWVLYYGDAEAHLNIARRIADSRTPGYEQIGTVWLPLPHLLLTPLAEKDHLWQSGLAGSVPSCAAFILLCLFFFLAARRMLGSGAAALAGMLALALNPNLLYLQTTAMTEPLFLAAFLAAIYFLTLLGSGGSAWPAAAAGLAALGASLTRYEGWFVIPLLTLWAFAAAKGRRVRAALLLAATASLGPLYWLGHNLWLYSDPLEFYHGPYSAKAIYQRALDAGMARYPGDGDWRAAWQQFGTAARLATGWPLLLLGLAGTAAALARRIFWAVLALAALPVFYVWSVVSSGTPIFVPGLWPNSYYNTRYGLAALPLLALGCAALVRLLPGRRWISVAAALGAALAPWAMGPGPENWICWKESAVNSAARRDWTRQAAEYLGANYRGGGVAASFGDLTGIFRAAGIPLREVLHEGNGPAWLGAVQRPDLMLHEEWAVAVAGDKLATAIQRAQQSGPRYRCAKMIAVKGAPVIEIYRRDSTGPARPVPSTESGTVAKDPA